MTIRAWHNVPVAEVERSLGTSAAVGLDESTARARLECDGPNELEPIRPRSRWAIAARQFRSLVVVLLVVAGALALATGEPIEAAAILVVVVLNFAIGFATEAAAERAMTSLRRQAALRAHVLRSGVVQEIAAASLVVGDVVVVAAGDRVPADGRVIEAVRLEVDEAALTGESQVVGKTAEPVGGTECTLAEQSSMLFLGTNVTAGRGRLLVTATGAETEVGRIGSMIRETVHRRTPLERRLDQLGRVLVAVVFGACAAIVGLGVLRGESLMGMIEIGISLAIAAVPEGLPAVATMTLAIGVQRMARANALVRRLPAVETLGSTTVICTDKTGTLTRNEMRVTHLFVDGLELPWPPDSPSTAPSPSVVAALRAAVACNDARLDLDDAGRVRMLGDPLEGALILAGLDAGIDPAELAVACPRVDEVPFDSVSRRMVTVHAPAGESRRAYLKGAPETILDGAARTHGSRGCRPLGPADRERFLQANHAMAERGLRVLAVAELAIGDDGNAAAVERGWTVLGLIGLEDPIRAEVPAAIERCTAAGIRIVMLTGDQPATASAVARQLGLLSGSEPTRVAHARELDGLSADALDRLLDEVAVLARVSPLHKLQVVEALQRRGDVVAMTGDGVNDAPALHRADIGVAMGGKGTAVAKEASDLVIRDDNFATIVTAIEQGRVIYANIRRFIHYLFACNLSEVLTVTAAILLGMPLPLGALQILWLNLVTDVFPALALALEPPARDAMRRPPRPAREPLVSASLARTIVWQALLLAAVCLAGFSLALTRHGHDSAGLARATTVSFATLAMVQTFYAFSARSRLGSVLDREIPPNRWLWLATLVCLGLQLLAIHTPLLQRALGTVPLDRGDWAQVLASALVPLLIIEAVNRWRPVRG